MRKVISKEVQIFESETSTGFSRPELTGHEDYAKLVYCVVLEDDVVLEDHVLFQKALPVGPLSYGTLVLVKHEM